MTCVAAFVLVGLYTLYYDVSLTPFFIVMIIDFAILVHWFINSDRL